LTLTLSYVIVVTFSHAKKENNVSNADFLQFLKKQLGELYQTKYAGGICHDVDHVRRVEAFGPRIAEATGLVFDPDEWVAAVWLHNLDRIPGESYRKLYGPQPPMISAPLPVVDWSYDDWLQKSKFDAEARNRIIDAVQQHSKFKDDPADSHLLTALRIADKLDSLGPIGIVRSVSGRSTLPLYDPQKPFGFGSTVEGRMKTVYDDFFRVVEWVGMMPSDAARALINKQEFRANIDYLRALGREIAGRLGVDNLVEQDIKKALGSYYEEYAC